MTNQMKEYSLPRRMLMLMTALMVISTVLFAIGILLERTGEAGEAPGVHTEVQGEHPEGSATASVHNESAESGGEHSETITVTATSPVITTSTIAETHAETILGINIENPLFVLGAVVVWTALTIGLWLFGKRVLIPVIIVAVGTALFDAIHIITQINRLNTGITLLAVLITVLHLVVAVLAYRALVSQPSTQSTIALHS